MPELPEVETVRQGLASAMTGARIKSVALARGDLRTPFSERFVERLVGRKIENSRVAPNISWFISIAARR